MMMYPLWQTATVRAFHRFVFRILSHGGDVMGDRGAKDKGKREKQKKAQHTLKEKRKIKREKKSAS